MHKLTKAAGGRVYMVSCAFQSIRTILLLLSSIQSVQIDNQKLTKYYLHVNIKLVVARSEISSNPRLIKPEQASS